MKPFMLDKRVRFFDRTSSLSFYETSTSIYSAREKERESITRQTFIVKHVKH